MHKSDLEALEANAVWQAMKETLQEMKLDIYQDLCNIDPAHDAGLLARQQGMMVMVDTVLRMPQDILIEAETANKEERKEG